MNNLIESVIAKLGFHTESFLRLGERNQIINSTIEGTTTERAVFGGYWIVFTSTQQRGAQIKDSAEFSLRCNPVPTPGEMQQMAKSHFFAQTT